MLSAGARATVRLVIIEVPARDCRMVTIIIIVLWHEEDDRIEEEGIQMEKSQMKQINK